MPASRLARFARFLEPFADPLGVLAWANRARPALAQAARATALIAGRDYIVPEDILDNIIPVCAHRLITKAYSAGNNWETATRILAQVVESVTSPV